MSRRSHGLQLRRSGNALYIVRAGEFEIYVKNDQGEKIVLEVSQPGEVFGEVSLLDSGPRTAWVAAIGEAEVLRLDRQHFEDYVRQYTPAALNLLSVAARRLRKSDEVIRRTTTRNVNDVAAEQDTLLTRFADLVPSYSGSMVLWRFHAVHGYLDRAQCGPGQRREDFRCLPILIFFVHVLP